MTGHKSRWAVGLLALGALTACTSGISGGGSTPTVSAASEAANDKTPVTLTVSSYFTGREKADFDAAIKSYTDTHPWVTVKSTGGQSTDNQLQSIRSGHPSDIIMNIDSTLVPSYCQSGSLISLDPYMQRDSISPSTFLPAAEQLTSYKDNHCTVPLMADVYALYYNKTVLSAAGITTPPKTWDELAADAKKTTVKNADGSLKQVGFLPYLDYEESNFSTWTPGWGLTWFDDNNQAQMATDQAWNKMLTWQKSLIDYYGSQPLNKFKASLGDEWSTKNSFYTNQTPMMIDGEWRVAFIQSDKANVDYDIAPIPTVDPSKYGGGFISAATMGIPKGSQHPEQAWQLVKYLSTNTDAVVKLANALKNIPTTVAAFDSPELSKDPHFVKLLDIAKNPNSITVQATLAGAAPATLLAQKVSAWQTSSQTDPTQWLADVTKQINAQVSQATMGK